MELYVLDTIRNLKSKNEKVTTILGHGKLSTKHNTQYDFIGEFGGSLGLEAIC
jgi:hypothetical protein